MTQPQSKLGPILTWAVLLGSLAAVVGFAGLALYLHPCADDYSFAVRARQFGFWGAQAAWYMDWTGRYASSAILSLLSVSPVMDHYWVWSLALFAAFPPAMYWLTAGVFGERLTRLQRLAVTFAVTALYVGTIPSPVEGFYWLAGGLTYQGGNVVAMVFIAAVLSRRPQTPRPGRRNIAYPAVCALLGLLAAGFNETLTLLLVVLTAVGLVVSWRRKLPTRMGWLAGMIACLAGAAVMFLAPGNSHRQTYFADAHQFGPTLFNTMCLSGKLLGFWLIAPPMLPAALLWLGFVARGGRMAAWGSWRILGRVALLVAAMLSLTLLPSYWAMGIHPPWRVCNESHFVLVLGFVACLTVLGARLGRRRQFGGPRVAAAAGAGLTALFLVAFTWLGTVNEMKTIYAGRGASFDRQMQARQALIAQSQGQDLRLAPLADCSGMLLFCDISADPQEWHNLHFAQYWGLKSVRLTDGPP